MPHYGAGANEQVAENIRAVAAEHGWTFNEMIDPGDAESHDAFARDGTK